MEMYEVAQCYDSTVLSPPPAVSTVASSNTSTLRRRSECWRTDWTMCVSPSLLGSSASYGGSGASYEGSSAYYGGSSTSNEGPVCPKWGAVRPIGSCFHGLPWSPQGGSPRMTGWSGYVSLEWSC